MSWHTCHMVASGSRAHHSCAGSIVVGNDVLLLDTIHHICKRSCNNDNQAEAMMMAGHGSDYVS